MNKRQSKKIATESGIYLGITEFRTNKEIRDFRQRAVLTGRRHAFKRALIDKTNRSLISVMRRYDYSSAFDKFFKVEPMGYREMMTDLSGIMTRSMSGLSGAVIRTHEVPSGRITEGS